MRSRRVTWAMLAALAACGDNLGAPADDAATVDAAMIDAATVDAAMIDAATVDAATIDAATVDAAAVDGATADAQACATVVTGFPLAPGVHVEQCSQVVYATNPPTSGSHYPNWARYKTYPAPIGRPFWVHDLEHGAVVITYRCPLASCPAELAALDAFLAARPADPLCVAPVKHRIIVTPDPLLDVRFAASAWGFALESDCFDLVALGAFLDAHYAHAPENLCADGIDPLDPALGLPPNCP